MEFNMFEKSETVSFTLWKAHHPWSAKKEGEAVNERISYTSDPLGLNYEINTYNVILLGKWAAEQI